MQREGGGLQCGVLEKGAVVGQVSLYCLLVSFAPKQQVVVCVPMLPCLEDCC